MKRQFIDTETETTDSEVSATASSDEENHERNRPQKRGCLGNSPLGPPYSLTLEQASHEWERSREMRDRKNSHQEALDAQLDGDREAHIYATVLKGRDVHIEENMFPYECDEGVTHWTLWSRRDLSHDEILHFVSNWCIEHAPWVAAWAYEENSHFSFCVPHVHVFFRRRTGTVVSSSQTAATSGQRQRTSRWDVPPQQSGPLTDVKTVQAKLPPSGAPNAVVAGV